MGLSPASSTDSGSCRRGAAHTLCMAWALHGLSNWLSHRDAAGSSSSSISGKKVACRMLLLPWRADAMWNELMLLLLLLLLLLQ